MNTSTTTGTTSRNGSGSGSSSSAAAAAATAACGLSPLTKLTPQAQERRAELLNDPRARMVDLFSVRCLKCGTTIKLSPKGLYDLHHWVKHWKRCDKWSEEYAAARRAENGIVRIFRLHWDTN